MFRQNKEFAKKKTTRRLRKEKNIIKELRIRI